MARITQNLFEEIQKVTSSQLEEKLKHDEDGDGDEDAADYMMKRRKAGGQSHAQAHAATRKHNEEAEQEGETIEEDKVEEAWPGTPEHKAKHGTDYEKHMMKYGGDPKAARATKGRYGYEGASGSETPETAADSSKVGRGRKKMKEETIVKHADFMITVTDNPTFQDFFNAARTYVEDKDDAVIVAEAFHNDEDTSIIIESEVKYLYKNVFEDYEKDGYLVENIDVVIEEDQVQLMYSIIKEDSGVKHNYIHHGTVVAEEKGEE